MNPVYGNVPYTATSRCPHHGASGRFDALREIAEDDVFLLVEHGLVQFDEVQGRVGVEKPFVKGFPLMYCSASIHSTV